jgi:hypothetical protein
MQPPDNLDRKSVLIPPASRSLRAPIPTPAVLKEPDEVLVPDPRFRLTPAQFVDQKLLKLLGCGSPGLYIQASGRPENVRRQTGE